ncbi:MAG: winged helix-turn-helix transcriptional regulator [Candidatus Pacebacteria bacterium]|nr:winged helix-turn-helix transcriptional regulator [Candidatus Paceibacterota bacterium]
MYKYKNKKTYRQLERLVKGFANHRRIQVMELLKKKPELSVIEIAEELSVNVKTISDHIKKLAMSGLILKRNELQSVRHKLTKNGEQILKFLRTLT